MARSRACAVGLALVSVPLGCNPIVVFETGDGSTEGDSGPPPGDGPSLEPVTPVRHIVDWALGESPQSLMARDRERSDPFSGVMFALRPEGHSLFDGVRWTEAEMELDTLASMDWGPWTHNFLVLEAGAPDGIDFSDDQRWSTIAGNLALFARAGRVAGVRGIFLNVWPRAGSPWAYDPALFDGADFEEASVVVRRRGQQAMDAIESELPRAILFGSYLAGILQAQSEDSGLESANLGLFRPFLEGMVEAAGPEVRFVDGLQGGIWWDDTEKFRGGKTFGVDAADVLAAPFSDTYRNVVEMAAPLRTDHLLGPAPTDAERNRWLHNAYHALLVSDRYVWTWTDDTSFVPGEPRPGAREDLARAWGMVQDTEPLGFDLYKPGDGYWEWGLPVETIDSIPVTIRVDPPQTRIVVEAQVPVDRVELWVDDRVVAQSDATPWTTELGSLGEGPHVALAVGIDDDGRHGSSAPLFFALR